MSATNPFIVYDARDGREICQCAALADAEMMVGFDPDYRRWKVRRIVLDHVVDVPSVPLPSDPQLPAQKVLPDRQQVPFQPSGPR